ncbi:hypothetical protein CVT25_003138 [Psilocybe cyanescens]|uniref:Uncharacterized protein n=1 Tax=Psilocybe cyanescens TaxID=93625 RepID=A0A409WMR3_PSICY|nr:hypothetical protein CVT25_003138 [Psilocybe cyanescens]
MHRPLAKANEREEVKIESEEQEDHSNAHKLHGGFAIPLEESLDSGFSCTDHLTHDVKTPVISAEAITPPVDEEWKSVWLLDTAAGNDPAHPGIAQPDVTKHFEPTLLTRKTDPSHRLHLFIPKEGTELEKAQNAIEKEWRRREEEEDEVRADVETNEGNPKVVSSEVTRFDRDESVEEEDAENEEFFDTLDGNEVDEDADVDG